MDFLDLLIDFWGHLSGGFQTASFGLENALLGFRGSGALQGDRAIAKQELLIFQEFVWLTWGHTVNFPQLQKQPEDHPTATPACYRGLSGPSGPKCVCPRECPRSVSRSVSGALRAPGKVSQTLRAGPRDPCSRLGWSQVLADHPTPEFLTEWKFLLSET